MGHCMKVSETGIQTLRFSLKICHGHMCLKLEKVWKIWKKGKAENKSSKQTGLFGFSFTWYVHQNKLAGEEYPLETLSVSTEMDIIYTTKLYIQRWQNMLTLADISADRALHNLLERPYIIFWKDIIFRGFLFVWKQELKMGFSKHILLLQHHQFKSNNSETHSFSHLSLLSNTPSSKVLTRSISSV